MEPPAIAQLTFRDKLRSLMSAYGIAKDEQESQARDFQTEDRHKAIAVSPEAHGTFRTALWATVAEAEVGALEGCQIAYGRPCALIAIDDQIEPAAPLILRDMPRPRYTGVFDSSQIPRARPELLRRADVTNYAAAPGPKAAAYHPEVTFVLVTGAADQLDAEEQALAQCNNTSKASGGPCFLYAVGNQVVLPQRSVKPISRRQSAPQEQQATAPRQEPGERVELDSTRIEFDSMARDQKERVWGYLSFPVKLQEKYPLMLILHSSGGLHERDWFFARTLNEIGVATFVLDSFGPRDITNVPENKRGFTGYRQVVDALNALDKLSHDQRIDTSRIGAMGRSLGGETSIYLSLQAVRARMQPKAPPLSLALAITPGCMSQEQDGRASPQAEIHFFLADKDFSPYQRCIDYVHKINRAGGHADHTVYPDTFHVFDGSMDPVWHPGEEVYAGCDNEFIAPDRSVRLDTGALLRTRKEWDDFFAGCVKHGTWTGGSPEATRQLDRDWTNIVKQRWLSPRAD